MFGYKSNMSQKPREFVRYVKIVGFTERLLKLPDKAIRAEREPTAPGGFRYPLADQFFGDNSVKILDDLANEGLLSRQFQSRELACPTDGSLNVTLRQFCTKCDSADFSQEEIIEHLVDGYIGPESEFKDGICPKDKKPLKKLGVDYVKHGRQYVCHGCVDIFQQPVLKLACLDDGTIFEAKDAKEVILYSYTATNTLEEEINKVFYHQKYIQDNLNKLGFKVESPATLKGKSGISQDFFMVAWSGIGFLRTNVIVELLGDSEVREQEVFSTYSKAIDVGVNGIIVAAVPKLSEGAKKVANTYGIAYIEARDIPSVSEGIIGKFKELMTSPIEEAITEKPASPQ